MKHALFCSLIDHGGGKRRVGIERWYHDNRPRCLKQKDRLAAVSPKSDQVFGSDGCECSRAVLRPVISKEAETDEARQDHNPGGG